MPTIPSMDLPKPKNWQEFEMIVRDSLVLRCRSSGFQKHGKSGQKQSGVDIIGPDEIGRLVGIQCKRYDKPLTMKQVVIHMNDLASTYCRDCVGRIIHDRGRM